MNEIEHSVLKWLPYNDQIVMCYGHKTYCCSEDMDEQAEWHKVKFHFSLQDYKIKDSIPEDPEESLLEYSTTVENWDLVDADEHVIGVTKWKQLASQ